MYNRRVICYILYFFLSMSFNLYSSDPKNSFNEGYNIGKNLQDSYSSSDKIKREQVDPVQGHTQMQTRDNVYVCSANNKVFYSQASCLSACSGGNCEFKKHSFDGKVTCQSTKEITKINIINMTGSEGQLSIGFDLDMNGQKEHTIVTHNISGLCLNGYYSCNPGTNQNCRYFAPGIRYKCSDGREYPSYFQCDKNCSTKKCQKIGTKVEYFETDQTETKTCFCTNAYCRMSFNNNIEEVFKNFTSSIAGILSNELDVAISDTKFDPNTLSVSLYGADYTSCSNAGNGSNTVNDLKEAYKSGNLDGSAEFTKQMADDNSTLYAVMRHQNQTGTYRMCSIRNEPSIMVINSFKEFPNIEYRKTGLACGAKRNQYPFIASEVKYLKPDGTVETKSYPAKSICADHYVATKIEYINNVPILKAAGFSPYWIMDNNCSGQGWVTITNLEPNIGVPFSVRVQTYGSGCSGGDDYTIDAPPQDWTNLRTYNTNSCTIYEQDPKCDLSDEKINGKTTMRNFNKVYNSSLSICKKINYSQNGNTFIVCDEKDKVYVKSVTGPYTFVKSGDVLSNNNPSYFSVERTYYCKDNKTFDFSDAQKQADKVGNTLDYKTGNFQYYKNNITASDTAPTTNYFNDSCVYSCSVKYRSDIDTTVNAATVTRNDISSSYIEKEERTCLKDADGIYTCPIKQGETVLQNCRCLDNFNEAVSILSVVTQAAKDIICSSQ